MASCFVLLQNKTLSLNPSKKAVLTLRRPFGSEAALSVDSQPIPVVTTAENNDVLSELEAPATHAVASTQIEVHCWCVCSLAG